MRLLDKDLIPIGEVDLFKSSTWHVSWYDYGKFEMRCQPEAILPGTEYILNQDIDEVAIITAVERTKRQMIIKGKTLLFILNRFVINETVNYTNKTSEYIAKDLVKRFGPANIIVEESTKELGKVIDTLQVTGENLGDYIIEILAEQELSAHIDFDYVQGQMKFTVRSGQDNTINKQPITESFDTLQDYEYNWDKEDYRNFAYVAGEEKEGQTRVIVEVDVRSNPEEPIYALWVDARATRSDGLSAEQYKEALKQKGLEKLKKYEVEELIDITPSVNMPPGAEIELGELRLFRQDGLESTQRITGIIYGYEEGAIKKAVMFGNQNLLKKDK